MDDGSELDPGVNPVWYDYAANVMGVGEKLTDQEWSKKHGVADRTLRRWKKNPKFIELLEEEIAAEYADPSKRGEVLEAAYRLSINWNGKVPPNVQAQAQTNFTKMMDQLRPMKQPDLEGPPGFEEMSEAEFLEAARRFGYELDSD